MSSLIKHIQESKGQLYWYRYDYRPDELNYFTEDGKYEYHLEIKYSHGMVAKVSLSRSEVNEGGSLYPADEGFHQLVLYPPADDLLEVSGHILAEGRNPEEEYERWGQGSVALPITDEMLDEFEKIWNKAVDNVVSDSYERIGFSPKTTRELIRAGQFIGRALTAFRMRNIRFKLELG